MAAPTQIVETQYGFPEEIAPYAQKLLGQAQLYTDPTQRPYQQYLGDRFAQFTPLQQQAFTGITNLEPSYQLTGATGLAGTAGQQALGTQYDPSQFRAQSFTRPGTVQQYMSPYQQGVVDIQQREAKRQADIQNQALGAQAARSGAFGGSRQAILQGEANRALQTQLQGIQATGLQNAYQQAMQQFNQEQQARQAAAQLREQSRQYGAGLGMQGLQTGLQAAQTLGSLGQSQFGQSKDILGLQQQAGATQQQQIQNILNAQYQDFLNEQAYPYKQLGFMSDILRGQQLSPLYQVQQLPAPTALQNLSSLALTGYGLSKMAKGGSVQSYDDGGSVLSRENKEDIVDGLHPAALPVAQRNAMVRGDRDTYDATQDEMAEDAAIRRGIAAAAPYDIGVGYAADGIVAFADGGDAGNSGMSFVDIGMHGFTPAPGSTVVPGMARGGMVQRYNGDDDNLVAGDAEGFVKGEGSDLNIPMEDLGLEATSAGNDGSVGNAGLQQQYTNRLLRTIDRMEADKGFTPLTAAERRVAEKIAYEDLVRNMGPDIYEPAEARLKEDEAARGRTLEQNKGLAALKAASAVLRPGGTLRGITAAGEAFADSYDKALAADRAEKRYINQMQFSLADAKRKERLGLTKEARALVQNAEASGLAAANSRRAKDAAIANALGRGVQATRPAAARSTTPRGMNASELAQQQTAQIMNDLKTQHPDWSPTKLQAEATRQFLALTKAGTSGAAAKTYGDAAKDYKSYVTLNKSKVDQIVKERFGGDYEAFKEDYIGRFMQNLPTDIYSVSKPKAGAGAPAAGAGKSDPLGIR